MKCIAYEKLCEATAEEMDSEEYGLILCSLKIYLEGNNKTVKSSTFLGNTDWINKV